MLIMLYIKLILSTRQIKRPQLLTVTRHCDLKKTEKSIYTLLYTTHIFCSIDVFLSIEWLIAVYRQWEIFQLYHDDNKKY